MGKKRVKCSVSTNTGSSVSGVLSFDPMSVDRRQFLHSTLHAGAAAFFALQPAFCLAKISEVAEPAPQVDGLSKSKGLDYRMVSPVIDDLRKPWCYLAHTSTLIGVPWMPDAVQVTYDGAIFTRHAELCFFYGNVLKPVMQRQKRWLDGWIPVLQYDWSDGGIGYEIEMFSSVLDGFNEENTLQFVRVHISNTSPKPALAVFAAASRSSGGEWRFGDAQFLPTWTYDITGGVLYRANEFVYSFPTEGVSVEGLAGQPSKMQFIGDKYSVTKRTPVCLARYSSMLASGQTVDLVFKMPRVPTQERKYIQAAQTADYRVYRERTVQHWQKLLGETSRITVTSEPMVEQAHRATAVQVLLATRTIDGHRAQTEGLPYPETFLASMPDYGLVYDNFGLPDDYVRANVRSCRENQQPDGMFLDVSLVHGKIVLTSHGEAMLLLLNHALRSQDIAYTREIWPMIRLAVDFIQRDHKSQLHGLMRPTWPYDAEMIQGQYTCHNLMSLNALRAAVRAARLIDESADAESWLKVHDSYQSSVLKALNDSAASDGYIPTGLYKFITGEAARKGFGEWQTDQDFENMLLAWPGEALSPSDWRVVGTVDRLRTTKYREGIMTYRNCMHLHHYITVNSAMQDVVAGRDREALLDAYHILLHCGSTFEGFETLVFPWTDRDTHPMLPPPHAWGEAKINGLLRNMFVVELGGRYGLDEGQRDLRLFSVISPAWCKPGERIAVENAHTEFGVITATMQFHADGADVTFMADFHHQPRGLVFHMPYFIELVKFSTDAKRSLRDGVDVRVSPDAKSIRFTWRQRPAVHRKTTQNLLLSYRREPGFWKGKRIEMPTPPKGFLTSEEQGLPPALLSFVTVRDAWRREYARRYDGFVQAGGDPVTIVAPPLQG